jgi:hypothetical protein
MIGAGGAEQLPNLRVKQFLKKGVSLDFRPSSNPSKREGILQIGLAELR